MEETSLSPLRRFFGNLILRSFGELWIRDEKVINYISDLLTEFARTDKLYRIKNLQGKRLESVVEMLLEAQRALDLESEFFNPFREREIRKHIGDYALFMTGIFREYVERKSVLKYYIDEGSRSYFSVSQFDRLLYKPEAFLFRELSENFEFYMGALNYTKKVHLRPEKYQGPYQEIIRKLSEW